MIFSKDLERLSKVKNKNYYWIKVQDALDKYNFAKPRPDFESGIIGSEDSQLINFIDRREKFLGLDSQLDREGAVLKVVFDMCLKIFPEDRWPVSEVELFVNRI